MLDYFANEMVTATWYDGKAGTNVKGVYTPGFEAGVPIRIIAPQPVKADELSQLADGEHVSDYLRTWAKVADLGTREGLKSADEIEYNGDRYKVAQQDNRMTLGGFVRVLLKRVG